MVPVTTSSGKVPGADPPPALARGQCIQTACSLCAVIAEGIQLPSPALPPIQQQGPLQGYSSLFLYLLTGKIPVDMDVFVCNLRK